METIIEWQSKEHHFDKKSVDWYWGLGIIATGGGFLSFYFGNWIFGIFIILAALTIGILSFRETRIIPIKISAEGIVFNRSFFPFSSYVSFWIEEEHVHGSRILLRSKNRVMPLTVIPIHEEINLEELRDILDNFLPLEFLQESIFHKWLDHLIAR